MYVSLMSNGASFDEPTLTAHERTGRTASVSSPHHTGAPKNPIASASSMKTETENRSTVTDPMGLPPTHEHSSNSVKTESKSTTTVAPPVVVPSVQEHSSSSVKEKSTTVVED